MLQEYRTVAINDVGVTNVTINDVGVTNVTINDVGVTNVTINDFSWLIVIEEYPEEQECFHSRFVDYL